MHCAWRTHNNNEFDTLDHFTETMHIVYCKCNNRNYRNEPNPNTGASLAWILNGFKCLFTVNNLGEWSANSREPTAHVYEDVRQLFFLTNFFIISFANYIGANPICRLFPWMETAETPRLSLECWRPLPTYDRIFDSIGFELLTLVLHVSRDIMRGSRPDDW